MDKNEQMTKAEIDAIVYECRQNGNDTTYDIVNAALARAGMAAPTEPTRDIQELVHYSIGSKSAAIACAAERVQKWLAAPTGQKEGTSEQDAKRLDFLDINVHRFRMGWRVGAAPVGNLSVQSIIMGGLPIREAIDAAMSAAQAQPKDTTKGQA